MRLGTNGERRLDVQLGRTRPRPRLRWREKAREDRLHADAREPHRDLHVVARALPGANLADAERRVPQLGPDLKAAVRVVVVLDPDLSRRARLRLRLRLMLRRRAP